MRFTSFQDLLLVSRFKDYLIRSTDDILLVGWGGMQTIKAGDLEPKAWKYLTWLKTPILVNATERRDWFVSNDPEHLNYFVMHDLGLLD